MSDNKKICFISCVNDDVFYEESLKYIENLIVPEGYTVDTIYIKDAKSMCEGYNAAMESSDAKYKVYLHQDVFIINKNFIQDVVNIFNENENTGMLGLTGAKSIPGSAIWWESRYTYGKIYESHTNAMKLLAFNECDKEIEKVQLIDGFIMITQYDVRWREELFDGWHFYDASQCIEFQMQGFDVAIPNEEKPWCMHDCGIVNVKNGYDEYRKRFIDEYSEYYKSKPLLSICIPTYNRSYYLNKCLKSIYEQIDNDNLVEVVISDNASTDGTQEIIEDYIKKYDNLIWHRLDKGIEGNKNLIRALKLGKGKFVTCRGDDDYFEKNSIQLIVQCILKQSDCLLYFLMNAVKACGYEIGYGADEYLKKTSIFSTAISCLVYNKKYLMKLRKLDEYTHTSLNQCYLQYKILQNSNKFCVIYGGFFSSHSGECKPKSLDQGYPYGQIFIKNYLEMLEYVKKYGIKDETIKADKYKILNLHIIPFGKLMMRDGVKIDSENLVKIYEEYYKNEPYFEEFYEKIKELR